MNQGPLDVSSPGQLELCDRAPLRPVPSSLAGRGRSRSSSDRPHDRVVKSEMPPVNSKMEKNIIPHMIIARGRASSNRCKTSYGHHTCMRLFGGFSC